MKSKYLAQSPILFIIFNRPTTTQVVFNAIKSVQPSKIYIAADGPREKVPLDLLNCAETRKVLNQIDWKCETKFLMRDKNLGCKHGVSQAIDWFFQHESEGIILEDDCLPHEDFFKFCDELLSRYRHDQRIGIISGTSLIDLKSKNFLWQDESFIFNRYPSIWGWATWSRVWQDYDVDIPLWSSNRKDISKLTFNNRIRKVNDNLFDLVSSGKLNTWDYQVSLMLWTTSRISIAPRFNLVKNIGFGPDATHTLNADSEISKLTYITNERMNFPLTPPIFMAPNHKYQEWVEKFATRSFTSKLFRTFVSYLIKLKNI